MSDGDEVTGSQDTLPAEAPTDEDDPAVGLARARLRASLFGAEEDPVALGRFELIRRLGAGGNGVVYAARDPELERKVAIKLLLPHRGGSDRLIREAQAMAALSHPNVAPVYEIGRHEDRVFVAMEFVDGETLRSWQADRDAEEIIAAYVQAGEGLAAAHAVGIVHRDFKPDNVMVGQDGRPRVLDFGLARSGGEVESISVDHGLTNAATLTATGAIVGTPAYMAPEQFAGGKTGPSADQFAFCISLYEALYGARPFEADNLADLATKVAEGDYRRPPDRPEVSARVRDAIVRGLSPDPGERFESMEALLAELRPPSRRGVGSMVLLAAVAVAAVLAVLLARREVPEICRGPSPIDAIQAEQADALAPGPLRFVDRYVQEWNSARETICAEPPADDDAGQQQQAAARACLDHHLELLEATLRRLPDESQLAADEIARRLPPPQRCASPNVPLSPKIAIEDTVDIRLQLARTRVLTAQARFDEALEQTQAAFDAAKDKGSPILEAEAMVGQFWAQWLAGDFAASQETAKAAALAAERSGDDYTAAAASAFVAMTAAILTESDRGRDWSDRASAAGQRVAHDAQMRGWTAYKDGTIAIVDEKYPEAVSQLEQAVELWTSTLGEDAFEVVIALNNLGAARERAGDLEGARAANEEQLRIVTTRFGPDSLGLRYPLLALARIDVATGDLAAAEKHAQRALRIVERYAPEGSVDRMAAHQTVARVLEAQSQWEKAAQHRTAAVEEARAVFGDDTRVTADCLHDLGKTLLHVRPAEGVEMLDKAIATMQRAVPGKDLDDDPDYAQMRRDLQQARGNEE